MGEKKHLSAEEYAEQYLRIIDKDGCPHPIVLRDRDRYYLRLFEKRRKTGKRTAQKFVRSFRGIID